MLYRLLPLRPILMIIGSAALLTLAGIDVMTPLMDGVTELAYWLLGL